MEPMGTSGPATPRYVGKFKVGQKVRIVAVLTPSPCGLSYNSEMALRHCGKIAVVVAVLAGKRYMLKDNPYTWAECWLKDAVPVHESFFEHLLALVKP